VGSLTSLGFSELEAEVYVALLRESPATGYRVAQSIGKPAANTYKAIESLQHKGAVLVDDGTSRLCRAVPAEELLAHLERAFRRRHQEAAGALASLRPAPDDDRVYQLQSVGQVYERCHTMLDNCERVAVLDLFPLPLEELRGKLEDTARRGVRLLVKAYEPAAIPGAEIVAHVRGRMSLKRWPGDWLNVVTDGREHLLAFLATDGKGLHQAVWSGSAYLSWVYHSAVASEVMAAALQRGLQDGAAPDELRRALAGYQSLFRADLPGVRALLERFGRREPPDE
jgi:HTH-type transcriptional regulator, sugar sensing transcriptional regulator